MVEWELYGHRAVAFMSGTSHSVAKTGVVAVSVRRAGEWSRGRQEPFGDEIIAKSGVMGDDTSCIAGAQAVSSTRSQEEDANSVTVFGTARILRDNIEPVEVDHWCGEIVICPRESPVP